MVAELRGKAHFVSNQTAWRQLTGQPTIQTGLFCPRGCNDGTKMSCPQPWPYQFFIFQLPGADTMIVVLHVRERLHHGGCCFTVSLCCSPHVMRRKSYSSASDIYFICRHSQKLADHVCVLRVQRCTVLVVLYNSVRSLA